MERPCILGEPQTAYNNLSILLMGMSNAMMPKASSLLEHKLRTLFAFPLRRLLALALKKSDGCDLI